ncbi:MAG: TolC family protein, partial [Candidatus Contendobacter sp.]
AREAAYQYEASRQTLENLQRELIRTVRNAYRGQETAISQIRALNQARVSTRSALEANQAGYEVGTRTIVDVLDAERNVYRAERDYAAARYAYVVNYLTLRQAAGQLGEPDLVKLNDWLEKPTATGAPLAPLAKPPTAAPVQPKKGNGTAAARAERPEQKAMAAPRGSSRAQATPLPGHGAK